MRSLLFCLLIISLPSCIISRQPMHRYADMNIKNVKTVRVPMFLAKPVIKIALKSEADGKEVAKLVSKMKRVRIMTGEMKSISKRQAANLLSMKHKGENWLSVKSGNSVIYINGEQKKDFVRKLTITVAEENNTFVHALIKCRLHPDDISRLISAGMENKTEVKKAVAEL